MSVLSELRSRLSPAARNRATATDSAPAPVTRSAPTAAEPDLVPQVVPDAVPEPPAPAFELTPEQISFFETFGFLCIPGLFTDEIGAITQEFERVFEAEVPWESHEDLHFNERRLIVPGVIDHSPLLRGLLDDPRVINVVTALIGADYVDGASDGSLFSCDTSWHPDTFGSPLEQLHVKLSFYLDPLDGENGAIRLLPGTNHYQADYAKALRRDLNDPASIESVFGVAPQDIPSWTLNSRPGDVVVWNFRTIHASFNGGQRRRLLSLNFKERTDPA